MPWEVSGASTLVRVFAAVGVVGAGQQQAGELAVGAGRGLQADVRQAADLASDSLQQPHQLQRALGAARVLGRVQAGVAGQRRDPLVEPRVVLHRAGAERVEAASRGRSCGARAGCSGGRSPARRSRAGAAARSAAGSPGSAPRAASPGRRRRAGRRRGGRASTSRRSSSRVRAASASRSSARHATPPVALTSLSRRLATLGGDRGAERLGELVDLLAACGAR